MARKKAKKKSNKASAVTQPSQNTDIIDSAVTFIRRAGGMAKAKELLSKLSMLQKGKIMLRFKLARFGKDRSELLGR